MSVGELVRLARERLGWTQSQLAEQTGVTPSYITKVEKDEALPSYDRLLGLANVLVLDSDQLLSLLEQKKQERSRQRIRTRGAAFRGAYGVTRGTGSTENGPSSSGVSPSTAEQLGREILSNPELQSGFTFLRAALADPHLKATVLTTLEIFAKQAKSRTQDQGGRRAKKDRGKNKG